MQRPGKTLIVIAGPTAIGKTGLAIRIAQHFDTEIVSADSRQFYRETTIGTAKPADTELTAIKHHFINSHSIFDTFTVGHFEERAIQLLEGLFQRYNAVVLAGGSGLYIDAVCKGFDKLPKADPGIRDRLNLEYEQNGIAYLQEELKKADPEYYTEVDLANPQRIIRALEVYFTTGTPFSAHRKGSEKNRPFKTIKIGLNTDRNKLYQQINSRVDLMIRHGLIDEVTSLLPHRQLNALKTVGYSEIFDFLDGNYTLEEAIDKIKQNTRNFAKRQLTWLRKDPQIEWFEPDQFADIVNYINSRVIKL